MSANGRGGMRPQSRSPPFLLIGLLVALVILAANYWSLSSNNASLSNEVSELQDQIRLLSTKNINSEKRNSKTMSENQELKLSAAQRDEDVKKRVKEVENLQAEFTKKQEEVSNLNQERDKCQSDLKACQSNSDGIQKELELLKDEDIAPGVGIFKIISNDKANVEMISACGKLKQELLSQIEKFVGLQVLKTLHSNGVDVMEYKDKVQNLPDKVDNQVVPVQQSSQQGQNAVVQQLTNGGTVINPQGQAGAPVGGIPAVPVGTGAPAQGAGGLGQAQGAGAMGQAQGAGTSAPAQGVVTGAPVQGAQGVVNPAEQNKAPVNQSAPGTKEGDDKKEESQLAGEKEKKEGEGKEESQPSIPIVSGSQQGANKTTGYNISRNIGFPANQIHPPNIEEMQKIMKNAVKDTIKESLNKLPGSQDKEIDQTKKDEKNDLGKVDGGKVEGKTEGSQGIKADDKDGTIITEQVQVADTVKNEKEAEAGANRDGDNQQDNYDEDEVEKDGTNNKNPLTNDKEGDKHFEEDPDKVDSLDRMRDQMENGI
ncbi:hypothetical protein FSP39_011848 [Pinctada imbricata]|uniref:Uncharacterized protein n=1 Tax=Pinctada imbricata TaxID=66713 RepID=A0AA88Y8U1_PINIB|nr:hypothetical protein FSP39_011848 [Pinctada imbricata]